MHSYVIFVLIYILTLLLALSETYSLSASALIGALFMAWFGINYGLFTYEEAISFIDVRLIILLIGVMITVEVANKSGLFRILGLYVIKLVKANPSGLFILLGIMSAATSLFLSDSAAILMISATALAISKSLGYDPVPFVTAAAIMVNLGGTGTLIGSVSNMIIGLNANFDFVQFAEYLLPCEISLWFITIGTLYLYYRNRLQAMKPRALEEYRIEVENLPELVRSFVVIAFMIVLFIFSDTLGVSSEAAAIVSAILALALTRYDPSEIFRRVDWDTVFFVAGFLFIVRGMEKTGILQDLSRQIYALSGGNLLASTMLTLFVSGFASIFLANIAVALTMTPVIKALPLQDKRPVWSALVLGTNLGGGTIPVTSIVFAMAIGALRHEEVKLDLGELTKVGFLATSVQLAFSALYLLIYFRLIL